MEIFKSPTGNKLSCKGWQQKGLLRLLLNCINLDIAKNPEELVAYGGTRKVARDINSLEAIIEALKTLESDETLLIQSGKPVGIFRTFEFAPRVIMTGDLLVHRWANWDYFRELAEKGLTAYGQSTAGSWAYIGTQGIFQGTWETFSQVAKRHFDGSLRGKLVLTSGLSEMGSTKPVAITANGGVAIVVNADRSVVKKRLISSMIDIMASSLQEACDIAKEYVSRAKSISIGVAGNASDAYEAILSNNIKPDVVKDQTPAHDIKSYIPSGLSPEEARELRKTNPEMYEKIAKDSIRRHVQAMIEFKKRGSVVFDYGNNLWKQGHRVGVKDAFCFPGFASEYIRPLFCEGMGPFRWIALSGDQEDIYRTDEIILSIFKGDGRLKEWIDFVERRFAFHGLPVRVCWLNYKERSVFGNIMNEMVKLGELNHPAL